MSDGADSDEDRGGDGSRRLPSVQIHLTLLACALTVLPVAAFGLNERRVWQVEAEAHADAELAQHATQIADGMATFLAGKQELLGAIAGGFGSAERWEPEAMQAMLDAQVSGSAGFSGVYIADEDARSLVFAPPIRADGKRLSAGVDYSDRDYIRRMFETGRIAWGTPQHGRQLGLPNLLVAAPIRAPGDGALRGAVGAGINLTAVQAVAAQARGVHDEGRAVMRTRLGEIVLDTHGKLPLLSLAPPGSLWETACPGPPPLQPVGARGVDEDGVEQRAMCSSLQIGEHRYLLLTTLSSAHISAEVDQATGRVKAAALLSASLAIIVANLAAWGVARRARRMVKLAEAVGRGDYSYRPHPPDWTRSREGQAVRVELVRALERLRSTEDELKAAVHHLELAQQRITPLAEAWEQAGEAMEIWTTGGQLEAANPASAQLSGTGAPAPGDAAPLASVRVPADGPTLLERGRSGQPWRGEWRSSAPGEDRVEDISLSPVRGQDGALRWIVVGRRDLSEQRRAEAAAQQNARLAAIGTLAAGVAHEVNNPLTVVAGALTAWEATGEAAGAQPAELRRARAEALRSVDQVRAILRTLLELGGGVGGAPIASSALSLAEAVEAACGQVAARRGQPPSAAGALEGLPRVAARPAELVQVLVQLIDNAEAARAAAGPDAPPVRLLARRADDEVCLEITDPGAGMDAETLARVFDPFFSTRQVGAGRGLGLPLSRSLVQGMGGALDLRSAPGAGTTAVLRLPVAGPQLERASVREPQAPAPLRRAAPRRVLVVDDDPPVARSVARMLRGHDVHIAIGGEEALRRMANERFEVVLCDVMMPEIDGPSLFAYAARGWPELAQRFVFMTGATTSAQVGAALTASGRPVLQKPLDPGALRAAIEELPLG
ncbi:MAG: hypothetical protein RL071_4442 [Pseudomonadota bacterium]